METRVDIVTFAKEIMGKQLMNYEVEFLQNFESKMQYASFDEWVRPKRRENQYLMNIWMSYQEYLNGTFDTEGV